MRNKRLLMLIAFNELADVASEGIRDDPRVAVLIRQMQIRDRAYLSVARRMVFTIMQEPGMSRYEHDLAIRAYESITSTIRKLLIVFGIDENDLKDI